MKTRAAFFSVFVLSLLSLLISIGLFWNQAIFADEHNVAAAKISGGTFWLNMDWLRLLLLLILCILSGFFATRRKEQKK